MTRSQHAALARRPAGTPAGSSVRSIPAAAGLEQHGSQRPGYVFWNLGVAALYEEALRRREGQLAEGGALVVRTGQHTGRSPNDKFIVREAASAEHVWWGNGNRPLDARRFDALHARVLAYLTGKDLFVQDGFVGAEARYRRPIRVITETAWHSLFARTMFRPAQTTRDLPHPPGGTARPSRRSSRSCTRQTSSPTRSGTGPVPRRLASSTSAGNSSSSGDELRGRDQEVGLHHHELPPADRARALHALRGQHRAEWGRRHFLRPLGHGEDVALSGCPADPHRRRRARLERPRDLQRKTRAAPTPSRSLPMRAKRKRTATRRTSSGSPAMPSASCRRSPGSPPSRRCTSSSPATRRRSPGRNRASPSGRRPSRACFGAPFMALRPCVYAKLLGEHITRHRVRCWLVNTGWTGGPYGTGSRIKIGATRAIVDGVLSGALDNAPTAVDPVFKFARITMPWGSGCRAGPAGQLEGPEGV